MSTALATVPTGGELVAYGMTRDQLELLKRTVAQGTTNDEFALFMTTAQRLELDPFTRQIYAVKRATWDAQQQRMVDKMTIQVGIDGFRAVADRTGENDGQDGPFWCGKDGVWRDVWLEDFAPVAAKVIVWRRGCSKPFAGVARFKSYAQTKKGGELVGQWGKMPDVMIAKCAEALGLRKAFPKKLSGVYVREEMMQADSERDAKPSNQRDLKPENALPPASAAANEQQTVIDAELVQEPPKDPEPSEVEREREWQSFSKDVNACTSIVALEAMVPRYQKLPKGSRVRTAAYELLNATKARLEKAADDFTNVPDDDIPF